MSEFIRLILVFVVVLVLIRRKVDIGLAMLAAAAFLGLLFQMTPLELGQTALRSAVDLTTIELLAALVLILFLENVMRKTMLLQRMVGAVVAVAGDRRLAMALLPAFVGFLPSVGGAVFSAPMVDEAGKGLGLSPERKSFINYWYRHLWEPVLPIYPSLIIISQVLQIPIGNVIAIQFPLTITAILAGLPLAFRGIEASASKIAPTDRRRHIMDLAAGLGPIVAVLALVLFVKLAVWLSLFLVIVALLFSHRYTLDKVTGLVREAFSFQIALLVIGVMVFKGILQESNAIGALPPFFASAGIPIASMAFILPFTVGLMTGMLPAAAAITFPIVAGLTGGEIDMHMTTLAFASGLAGVLLSPTHMCLVLTVQHFEADFGKVFRMVALPAAVVVGAGLAIYFIR